MTPRRWAESGLRALDKPGSQSRGQPTPPRGGAGQAGPALPKKPHLHVVCGHSSSFQVFQTDLKSF